MRGDSVKVLICSYLAIITIPWLIYIFVGVDDFDFPDHEVNESNWDLLYFSVVTVSTLGYGEIQPIGGFARTIAAIQSVLGPISLAYFVSRMFFKFTIKRDYLIEIAQKKEAFGQVQMIRRTLYASLTSLFESIVHDADPAPSGRMSVTFHDFGGISYPVDTTQHDHIHRREEARLHVLAMYESHGDVYEKSNLEYINRIDREIAYQRRMIDRFFYGSMNYPELDNETRIRTSEIINQLESIEYLTSELNSLPLGSPLREITKLNYFECLWRILQATNHMLSFIESLDMQGVTIDPVCPDPTAIYTPFDIDTHFNHWRQHKITGGIRFITSFKNELEKAS